MSKERDPLAEIDWEAEDAAAAQRIADLAARELQQMSDDHLFPEARVAFNSSRRLEAYYDWKRVTQIQQRNNER